MFKTKIVGFLLVVIMLGSGVSAQTPSSTNYSVEESSFTSGSLTEANSASFSASGAAGSLGVGSAFSANYGAYAGPINPNEEYLEMTVNATTVDLGTLDPLATSSGTGSFYVRAYLNSSYSVLTLSQPPTNESGDVLDGLTSTSAPTIGAEEFGINLVANTSPAIGLDPAPDPSASFANGQAASGYSTADQFRYVPGETIAENGSGIAWGQTNFTITYIANISNVTEAGLYSMEHDLVAVPTF